MAIFIGKGNLGGSPELKRISIRNGSRAGEEVEVASMRVRFSRYGQDGSGGVQEIGGYWREVEIYGSKAVDVANHLRKGARVLVIGDEVEYMAKDDDGNEVMVFKITADDVALILSRVESVKFAVSQRQAEQAQESAQEA